MVSKTNYFLVLVLPEFPSGISCSYFFSRKWSYVPTPCILRLIRGLRIVRHTQYILSLHWSSSLFEGMLILTQPLPTTLEASLLGFLTTNWMGTKSRNASMFVTVWSVQQLSTSMPAVFLWLRAAQYSSSGEANVGSNATDSRLPPSLWILHVLLSWPFSPHLLHCAVSPFSCSAWQSVQGSPTQSSFPSLVPSWSHASLPVPLNHFVPCASVLCSHGSSAAFSSTLWWSLPV